MASDENHGLHFLKMEMVFSLQLEYLKVIGYNPL